MLLTASNVIIPAAVVVAAVVAAAAAAVVVSSLTEVVKTDHVITHSQKHKMKVHSHRSN